MAVCEFKSCDEPRSPESPAGYCHLHYLQWQQGRKLTDLRSITFCRIDGCEFPVRSLELCRSHYYKMKRYGDPLAGTRYKEPPQECEVAWCSKRAKTQGAFSGLCDTHAAQMKRQGRITVPSDYVNDEGQKYCRDCDKWKDQGSFGRTPGLCVDCQKFRRIKNHYKLTREKYLDLLKSQGGVCAICASDGGARGLFVDHDHSCCPRNGSESSTCGRCIRALLCSSCNTGLGQFQDDPELLQKAINYLKSN